MAIQFIDNEGRMAVEIVRVNDQWLGERRPALREDLLAACEAEGITSLDIPVQAEIKQLLLKRAQAAEARAEKAEAAADLCAESALIYEKRAKKAEERPTPAETAELVEQLVAGIQDRRLDEAEKRAEKAEALLREYLRPAPSATTLVDIIDHKARCIAHLAEVAK